MRKIPKHFSQEMSKYVTIGEIANLERFQIHPNGKSQVGELQRVQLPTGETVDDLLIDAEGVQGDSCFGTLGRAGRNSFPKTP